MDSQESMETVASIRPVIALTGANGFVGAGIRTVLEQNFKVYSLQRNPEDPALTFELPLKIPDASFFKKYGITHLIHCAFDFSPLTLQEHQRINIDPYARLVNAAREGGVRNFLLISSMSAFGGTPSLYGQAKLAMEKLTQGAGGLSLRPGLVYAEKSEGLVGKMIHILSHSRFVPIIGNGGYPQYLTHREDLALVIREHFVLSGAPLGKVFFAAHKQAYRYKDLLKILSVRFDCQRHLYIHFPWGLIWLSLKTLEFLGLRPSFRSDSVVGLIHPNPDVLKGAWFFEKSFREF